MNENVRTSSHHFLKIILSNNKVFGEKGVSSDHILIFVFLIFNFWYFINAIYTQKSRLRSCTDLLNFNSSSVRQASSQYHLILIDSCQEFTSSRFFPQKITHFQLIIAPYSLYLCTTEAVWQCLTEGSWKIGSLQRISSLSLSCPLAAPATKAPIQSMG